MVLLAPEQTALRDQVNEALRAAMTDGRLEAMFRRWNVWNDDQRELYATVLAGADSLLDAGIQSAAPVTPPSQWELTRRYLPSLLRAAVITLVLSCVAMLLAVSVGSAIAIGRVYGRGWARGRADRLRRGGARHAGAAPALRPLLRAGVGGAAAAVRRGAARPRAELRGLRERDLPRRRSRPCRKGSSRRRGRSASAPGRRCG